MYDEIINMTASCCDEHFDADCIDSLPLAMAYVPIQKWRDVYSVDVAHARGTLFSELDKPFLGRRALH
ncbi:MAG: spore coat associated protein CotJA [Clostridia bacterium]|nr:spore coat associated protein CotJA [Clostridia bacterium]